MELVLALAGITGGVLFLAHALAAPGTSYADILSGKSSLAVGSSSSTSSSSGGATTSTGTATAASTGLSGSTLQMMKEEAQKYGWDTSQLSAWQGVVSKESGGSFTVLGSETIPGDSTPGLSRAYGFGQFLGSTFTEYLGPYGGTAATPADQIAAMAKYIHDRYGTPAAALAHEYSAGFY